jgi:hypothetical protein
VEGEGRIVDLVMPCGTVNLAYAFVWACAAEAYVFSSAAAIRTCGDPGGRPESLSAERCGDLIDGRGFGGAHLLAFLLVCGRDLVGDGEYEASVLVDLVAFGIAIVSRNIPPLAAATTIMPALGGPLRTDVHSSGENAALVVISTPWSGGLVGAAGLTSVRFGRVQRRHIMPRGVRVAQGGRTRRRWHTRSPGCLDLLRAAFAGCA